MGRLSKGEIALIEFCANCLNDPLTFVKTIFSWDRGDLKGYYEPDVWQQELLEHVGKCLQSGSGNNNTSYSTSVKDAIRVAVRSGHGVGKSAMVAWLIIWAMSTRPHLAGVITANTAVQLMDKSWRELALWHKRALNKGWFRWTSSKFYQVDNADTWFVSAVAWSAQNPEAFAGLHAKHVLMIFDEASAIDPIIYETAEGVMTTEGAMWFCLGNPTRNDGKFHDIHNRLRHRWHCVTVDSRDCKMTNKVQLKQWEEDYGEDSDFFRVRVRGEFPKQGDRQLISTDVVTKAVNRWRALYGHETIHDHEMTYTQTIDDRNMAYDPKNRQNIPGEVVSGKETTGEDMIDEGGVYKNINADEMSVKPKEDIPTQGAAHDSSNFRMPKILGVDVARFGDDQSVVAKRQGELCIKLKKFRQLDTMQLSAQVAHICDAWKPDVIFVDAGGIGAGVLDRLHQLGYPAIDVQFGAKADDGRKYLNKRAEMWDLMRKWLNTGAIPDDRDLMQELVSPQYSFSGDRGVLQLEKKSEMKRRGLASPDCADALALTFAYPVAVRSTWNIKGGNDNDGNDNYNEFHSSDGVIWS